MKKPVKNASYTFGFYIIISGLGFVIIHALINENSDLRRSFFIWGIILILLGLFFFAVSLMTSMKLKRLKAIGSRYCAKVEKIERILILKTNRKTAAFACCCYENSEGNQIRVKSNKFILDKKLFQIFVNTDKDAYEAIIYVNNSDPNDFAVEIFLNKY